MKKVLCALSMLALTSVAQAETLPQWQKVDATHDEWTVQLTTAAGTPAKINFVSTVDEEGKPTAFYGVRRLCDNDRTSTTITKAGNRLGYGLGCYGERIPEYVLPILLTKVAPLPPDAAALAESHR